MEFSPYAYPGRAFLALYLDPSLSWIPWELLFDGKTFLCERFNFSRRLVEKSSSEKRSARRTLSEWPWGRGILILYGDVQGLSATAEKSAIEDITHAARHLVSFNISKTAAEALELLQQGYDICHYIGHAVYDGASLAASGWRFGDGSILSAADLGRASSQASFPRLIFANSFFSARQTGNAESHITTMHRAFLNNGVSHYIGTTNNVPNASSVQFSSSFYSTLLAGVKVGAALCWARDTLRRSTQSSWMCYVAYGNPKDGKAKIRVNDLARELEVKSKAVLEVLPEVGVTEKKTHSSSLTIDEAERVRKHFRSSPEAQTSASNSARALCREEEIKTKIDLSDISRPGDVLRALTQRKEAVPAPAARPVPPQPATAARQTSRITTTAKPAAPTVPTPQPQRLAPRLIVPQIGPRPVYKAPQRLAVPPLVVPLSVPPNSQAQLRPAFADTPKMSTESTPADQPLSSTVVRPPIQPGVAAQVGSSLPDLLQTDRLHCLFIDLEEEGLGCSYQWREGLSGSELQPPGEDELISLNKLKDLASALSRVLQRLRRQPSNHTPDLTELQDAGVELYEKILSVHVAEELHDERECAYLEIHIPPELSWIPWELLSDGEHFLCQRFKIARRLQKVGKLFRAAASRRSICWVCAHGSMLI